MTMEGRSWAPEGLEKPAGRQEVLLLEYHQLKLVANDEETALLPLGYEAVMALTALVAAVPYLLSPAVALFNFGGTLNAVIGGSFLAIGVLCAFAALARRFSKLRLVRVLFALAMMVGLIGGSCIVFGTLRSGRHLGRNAPAQKTSESDRPPAAAGHKIDSRGGST